MSSNDLITIKARLRLKTADEGRRWSGIKTGYRPDHVFEYNKNGSFTTAYIGDIAFDKGWIQPGESETVTVRFLHRQSLEKYIKVGQKWWIHEGRNPVGEAEILEVEF